MTAIDNDLRFNLQVHILTTQSIPPEVPAREHKCLEICLDKIDEFHYCHAE